MHKNLLSFPMLVALVVGNMIGTGIYLLPASLATYGSISLYAWIYTAIGAIFVAITFAHLNKRFPKTGGPYIFCKEAFGPMTGFFIGIIYWLSNVVSAAGIAVACIGYLGYITPVLDANQPAYSPYFALLVELCAVWLFTLINIIGIHTAGMVQLILTIIKVIPLLLITSFGISEVNLSYVGETAIDQKNVVEALGSAAALTFWAFIGLEAATVPAENASSARDVYVATIFGTIITSLIYIASTFVLMGMIPNSQLQNTQFPFAQAATQLFGDHAALLVSICAIISGLGTLNVTVLIQAQILFATARDKLLPRTFAKLSKTDAPVTAQLTSSLICSVLLIMTVDPSLIRQFNSIALFAGLLTLVTYLVTTAAELKFLIKSHLSWALIFSRSSIYITGLAFIYCIWMVSNFQWHLILYAIIILLLSIPLYYYNVRHIK